MRFSSISSYFYSYLRSVAVGIAWRNVVSCISVIFLGLCKQVREFFWQHSKIFKEFIFLSQEILEMMMEVSLCEVISWSQVTLFALLSLLLLLQLTLKDKIFLRHFLYLWLCLWTLTIQEWIWVDRNSRKGVGPHSVWACLFTRSLHRAAPLCLVDDHRYQVIVWWPQRHPRNHLLQWYRKLTVLSGKLWTGVLWNRALYHYTHWMIETRAIQLTKLPGPKIKTWTGLRAI